MKQNSFSYKELLDCANGILFGKGNAQLPAPPMLMFDRVTNINETGGKGIRRRRGKIYWSSIEYCKKNNLSHLYKKINTKKINIRCC